MIDAGPDTTVGCVAGAYLPEVVTGLAGDLGTSIVESLIVTTKSGCARGCLSTPILIQPVRSAVIVRSPPPLP